MGFMRGGVQSERGIDDVDLCGEGGIIVKDGDDLAVLELAGAGCAYFSVNRDEAFFNAGGGFCAGAGKSR